MKKIAATLLCGVIMTSFVFCGCQKPIESNQGNESEIQTGETTEPTYVEINSDNFKKIKDLYDSKKPGDSRAVNVFLDGIRGEGAYLVREDSVCFDYSTMNGDSNISLDIDTVTNIVSVTFDLGYGETRYYGNTKVELTSVESLIDTLIDNPRAVVLFDDSAISNNEENIKKDLPLLYSRLIAFAEKAFPELGIGLEDVGIELGDKYRSLDLMQTLSTEIEVKNEHKFVNGICSDCGMCWTEYYYDAIGKLENEEDNTGRRLVYGQRTSTMMSTSDFVQCSADDKESGDVLYYGYGTKKETEESISCAIHCRKTKTGVDTRISMEYKQNFYSVGQGIISSRYNYSLEIEADAGDYAKVFESKESFKKYAKVYLYIYDDDGVGNNAWDSKNDDDLKKQFEAEGFTYLTKDEALDFFWDHSQGMLASIDTGMIWLDTSLADTGVNWKK